jgi:uncharacterized protein YdaU (DUF1376 family)
VNFYKRFIGDIQAKTGGLTLAEFGAYDRLLDHYYSTELPIPADKVYRICRAMSAAERAAVDAVLAEFFDLVEGGYAQSKADEVIAKAQPLIEAARANGKKGGRPKKQNPAKTQSVSEKNPAETQIEPSAKATQSQSQITTPDGVVAPAARDPLCPDGVSARVWGDWLKVRKAKRAGPVTETVMEGLQREAAKAGLTVPEAIRVCAESSWQGFRAEYLGDKQRASVSDWRAEQRIRTQQAAPGVAVGGNAGQFFIDVEARPAGVPALPN